jgi:hypothetical protein
MAKRYVLKPSTLSNPSTQSTRSTRSARSDQSTRSSQSSTNWPPDPIQLTHGDHIGDHIGDRIGDHMFFGSTLRGLLSMRAPLTCRLVKATPTRHIYWLDTTIPRANIKVTRANNRLAIKATQSTRSNTTQSHESSYHSFELPPNTTQIRTRDLDGKLLVIVDHQAK